LHSFQPFQLKACLWQMHMVDVVIWPLSFKLWKFTACSECQCSPAPHKPSGV